MTNYYDEIAGPNVLGYQDDIPNYFNAILAQNEEMVEAVRNILAAENQQDNAELVSLIVTSAVSATTGGFDVVSLSETAVITLWDIETNEALAEINVGGYSDDEKLANITSGILTATASVAIGALGVGFGSALLLNIGAGLLIDHAVHEHFERVANQDAITQAAIAGTNEILCKSYAPKFLENFCNSLVLSYFFKIELFKSVDNKSIIY